MTKFQILLVLALLNCAFFNAKGQTDSDTEMPGPPTASHQPELAKAQKGTYQFFIIGQDSTQLLRTDLAEKIESYRDETTVVHLKISSTTTIRILPKREILSPGFMPLTTEAVFQQDYGTHSAKR